MPNKLSLNVKKTTFMMFGTKKCEQSIPILLNGNVLDGVKCVKFLGIMLDERLQWSEHVNHVSLIISKALGIMYRIKNILPTNILRTNSIMENV